MTAVSDKTDVFVVGGGPAGLTAAIAARMKGFDVLAADAASPPIDKTCGEGLMPDALNALRRLGIHADSGESFAFRGIRFIDNDVRVEAKFPNGSGIALRRTRLHQILIDRAHEAGVRMLWSARVTGLFSDHVEVDGRLVPYRWLIGADGLNSRVRRWAGLDQMCHDSFRFGFRRHYVVAPWTDYMEVCWGSGAQMYVSGISEAEVCVVLMTQDSHMRLEQALPQFPTLRERLAGACAATPERGAVSTSRTLRRVYRGRIVLIGDASGSVDAITGEGMALSFYQAFALADALAANDLDRYQVAHRQLARRPHFMSRLVSLLDRPSWLRRRAMRALASDPAIFANLLAMHIGAIAPANFVLHGLLPLGRQILTTGQILSGSYRGRRSALTRGVEGLLPGKSLRAG